MSSIQIKALQPIGAEVRGADLSEPDAALFAKIHRAVLEYGVLVVRDQELEPAQQVALGRRFGELEGQDFRADAPHRDIILISNVTPEGKIAKRSSPQMKTIEINERWHTDSSFREIPATVSLFYGVVVPPVGGDTFFASLRRGWVELGKAEQAELIGLRAVHDYREAYRRCGVAVPVVPEALPPTAHPIVRIHPETGKPGLYISAHAFSIEGRPPEEGRELIEKLVAWCTREGRVYRHCWRPGDLVLWDNRSMLHCAQPFDERHARVMYHVRVSGSEPVIAA